MNPVVMVSRSLRLARRIANERNSFAWAIAHSAFRSRESVIDRACGFPIRVSPLAVAPTAKVAA